MRKALVVGIDFYQTNRVLYGCANDARSVANALETHGDGSINFGVNLRTATKAEEAITRRQLKNDVTELFADDSEIALLYFAGHGYVEDAGGYLCTSEIESGDDGLALSEVLTLARRSKAKNTIIVLDSCHSGVAGNLPDQDTAELSEGMTILTAATTRQIAQEDAGSGVFTTLFVDALNGAASNLVGEITPGSVYTHIDQSLGPWKQRPVFKTNVKQFVSLRKVAPPISLLELKQIATLFPTPKFDFPLDPAYEPELRGRPEGAPPPDPAKNAVFAILQKYNRLNLLVPVDAPHMWHAAIESKACRLTTLGEHYRQMVADRLI
jgi:hypothetical protein